MTIVIIGIAILVALVISFIYEITHTPDEDKMR